MATEETALVTVTLSPEALELIQFAGTFLATATAVQITTPEEAQAALDQTRRVKECAETLAETRFGYTRPLDNQKKAYMDAFRPAADSLERAEKLLKDAITAWNKEQARVAAEQEKERQRLARIEQDRQEKEQADAADLLRQADALAAAGDIAGAEALEDRAAAVQQVAAPQPLPVTTLVAPVKLRGTSGRVTWKCKVVDPSLLERAYLMPNQTVLDALAATARGVGPAPAGCEWVSSDNLSIRK